jgi:hypothetical protein
MSFKKLSATDSIGYLKFKENKNRENNKQYNGNKQQPGIE